MKLEAKKDCCEEAALGLPFYTPCNQPATKVVGWKGRSDTPIRMCVACTDHNVRNRGGYIVREYEPTKETIMTTEPKRYSIVGMNFRKSEKFVAALEAGAKLSLVREPTNKFDKNAVAVWCGDVHIGYVPKTQNAVLSKFIDENGVDRVGETAVADAGGAGGSGTGGTKMIEAKFVRSPNSSYPMAEV